MTSGPPIAHCAPRPPAPHGPAGTPWPRPRVSRSSRRPNWYVGHDGRTAYERLKGKSYKGEYLEFASCVLHRIPDKVRGGLMMERWLPGIWLGKRFTTDEHVVGLENGKVVRTRSVRQRPVRTCGRWRR